ncbi:hypothetical protein PC116_g25799 [Phytophthora cactorum]|nr:hypothetical protein Pcac1_g5274 [Phytophthora cactorum]KAG4225785.1 hypothetical protein PC116_g25799 [Phytophthora cactorum]
MVNNSLYFEFSSRANIAAADCASGSSSSPTIRS